MHVIVLLLLAFVCEHLDRRVWIEDSSWLGRNHAHLVGSVRMYKLRQAKLHHVIGAGLGRAIVDDVTFTQENDSIEHLEDFGTGLVDGGDDGLTSVGLSAQHLHKHGCCVRVQATGWLV